MTNFSALPVFTAVIVHESFTSAAQHLGISKSAVSIRVSMLERELGVKLLNRSTRKLQLTEAGELYYRHAVDAVASAKHAESLATSLQYKPSGVLKISAPWSLGRLYLSKIFPRFLALHPEIKLHVTFSDALASPIHSGVDVALCLGALEDSTLIARKLISLKSVICASPYYLGNAGIPLNVVDLLNHNCIISTHSSNKSEWMLIDGEEEQNVKVTGNYQVNNSEALHEAILQGVGIGRLPLYLAHEDIISGALQPLLQSYELPCKDLYAVFPHRQYLTPKVKVFVEYLIQELATDDRLGAA